MYEKRTSGTDGSAAILQRYIYSNHLGTVSLELDHSAAIISYEEYHPYGTTAYQAMNASINAVAKRYRYTGKERDEETGLYYHGARYYIPWLCRSMACDPINSEIYNASKGNSDKNRKRDFLELCASTYEYSYDNPIRFFDLNGEQPSLGTFFQQLQTSFEKFIGLDNINNPPKNIEEAKQYSQEVEFKGNVLNNFTEFKNDPGTATAKKMDLNPREQRFAAGGINMTLDLITTVLAASSTIESGGATATGMMVGLTQMSLGLTQIVGSCKQQS